MILNNENKKLYKKDSPEGYYAFISTLQPIDTRSLYFLIATFLNKKIMSNMHYELTDGSHIRGASHNNDELLVLGDLYI